MLRETRRARDAGGDHKPLGSDQMTMTADRPESSFALNPQDEINDLRMSAKAVPLLNHVKRFIKDVVEPMSEEFHRLGEGNPDIWSYDADYTYKDRGTGRIVVMQAISKPAANLGPSGPGKADGVGSVVAIDCNAKNMIVLGSYTPSKPLALAPSWRSDAPKKATGSDNEALLKTVCSGADKIPSK